MEPRLLALLALASVAIAGPITVQETNKCATQCPPSTKFDYAPGTTYMYDYRVDYSTSMSGASEDSAKLTLTATAELEVLGPCEMALSLRDTRLFHSDARGGLKAADGAEEFGRSLEATPLRFSYQNGVVEHLCSVSQEEPWILNVKKGVLSAFQNSMENLNQDQNVTETDVAGTCETQYQAVSNGYYSTSVKKVKDVLTCTDRHDYRTMLQMVPYDVSSELQNIPLMKTTHECDQVIQKGGVLESTTCTEMHIYRPFSNDQSGGATSVKQALTYKTYKKGTSSRQYPISSRDSLVYDHSASRPNGEQARDLVEQKLKEICDSTSYDVRPESPRLFSELVSTLKGLDIGEMQSILDQLKSKSLCPTNGKARKAFLDALPMIGSTSSVGMIVKLIVYGEDVKGLEAKAWIASLPFVREPTSEMLQMVQPLIDSHEWREPSLLPVSSMVNNFCSRSSSCDQSYAVLSIMASLERSIGSGCDASGEDFHQILLALRAIGNAGHAKRAVSVIIKCLSNSNNPLEIRVAAAGAFRRMPCDDESKELWNTYENADLDSELRIAAYQALLRCPTDATLSKMAASLHGDLDEQVGAYVYSHLTNLKETSDPHKQAVAQAMDNLVIPEKYHSSILKASSNLEASALINKINTGFVAESNLVWSNNAQIPRSASANLTVELFGQSVNLFDFGGRLEGLEHLIKSVFGPNTEDEKKGKDDAENKYHGSIYGRVFGNEMLFLHSKQIGSPVFDKISSKWLDMLITLSKKQEFSYSHSFQFLDASMTIPTVAGLPIHIDVNGSAVVDLVLNGKADLRGLGAAPRSVDIDGEIRPSAAMEITGTMSVDAHVTKTGLRMRNTLHTSTSLQGRIHLQRGEVLNVELDSPMEKMEIFDASSKFFILHNNVEQEQKMITENRKEFELCSCDRVSEITGVVLCGQVSFPNASMQSEGPYFPLTGPSSASLVLRKTDTHSGYKLLAKWIKSKTSSVAQISFNTPGSRVNRVILMDMSLDYPGQSIEAQVVSPWKTAAFTGSVVGKSDMKGLSGRLTVDNSDVYALTSQVKISQSEKKIQMNPMVEIKRPGADDILLSGFIGMEAPWKSLDMDLSLTGLQKLPYNLKTSLFSGKKETSLTASISDDGGKTNYVIKANSYLHFVNKKTTVLKFKKALEINTPKRKIVLIETSADYKEGKSLKLDAELDIHKLMRRPVTFKVDVNKNAKKRVVRYDVETAIKSSLMTGSVGGNIIARKNSLSSRMSVDYTIPKVAKNKIGLSGKFHDRSTDAYTKYSLKGNVVVKKNPEYNMGIDLGFDHKKKHSEAKLEVKYGPNPMDKTKRVYLNTVLKRTPKKDKTDVNYKVKAQAPEYNFDVAVTGNHEHDSSKVDSDVELTYGKNKNVKAAIALRDRSKKLTKLNGHATVSWPGTEYKLSSKLDEKSEKHFIHDITLKRNDGLKHSIDSEYKMPVSDSHIFSTVFDLDGHKKLTVSGSTNLDRRTPHASGEIKYGKDKYGLSTKAKMSKGLGGSVVVEMVHPERRVLMKVEGEKDKNKYDGSIEASWDADNDKSKMITMKGNTFNKRSRNSVSVGGEMSLTSPFKNFENLASSFKYGSDRAQHDITGKVSWGEKNKQFMSSATLQKPISLSHFVATVEAKTPFKRMRSASADISHTWGDALNTILKGNLNKENAKLVIEGEGSLKNLRGSAVLSSTINNAEDVSAYLTHTFDSGVVASSVDLNHNGDAYRCNLNMDHSTNGWQINNSGDLVFHLPKSEISTSWEHKNSDNDINSKLSSKWGNKRLNVHLSGSHELSHLRTINGEFKINSPWKSLGEVIVSLDHKHGDGFLDSKTQMIQDGTEMALSDVKFSKTREAADMDFILKSPMHEDLSGKLNAKYGSHPLTSEIEFEWAPRKKITAESMLSTENWDDAVFDFKLATPIRHYRKINLRASNKKEGEEMVSHANLDYGVRKTIDLETRHVLTAQNKMARLRLTTPFESVRSLDTGLRFDGHAADFESSADFEMVPVVEKYQGSAKWRYDGDLTGNLRLDTPHPEYPYFELSASNKDKGRVRKSRVEARLHPRQVYALDTAYSFDLPISVEATISSPYPEYDNLGLVFQHNHSPSRVDSHGELRYQANKKIEGDLNADWTSDIEGSLIVKTPFSGYETNKLAVRHHGDIDDFSSHGEINVAEKSVVADASFKSGHTTTGTFTLSSPITGMENIEVSLKKKGRARNFKGEAVLIVNNDKTEADYHHRLTKDGLKSSFKLVTPYIENIKLSFEHKGVPEQFTNEISANYGRKYLVDTTVTFDHNHPDVTGYGTIVYKLGGRKQKGSINFNKNGALEDMSFRGNAGFNDEEVSVSGSWKNINGLQGDLQISTPFKGFKNTGMTLSHEGKLNNFRSSASVTYMDKKTIDGNIDMKVKGLKRISLESEINTPFKLFPSARITFNHKYDKQQKTINGDASLTTPFAEFGSGTLTYEKTGSIKDFVIETSLKRNGREAAALSGTWNSQSEIKGNLEIKTPFENFNKVGVSVSHAGDTSYFISSANIEYMDDKIISGEIEFSSVDDLTLKSKISTPFRNFEDITIDGALTENTNDVSMNAFFITDVNENRYLIDGKIKLKDEVTGSLSVNTPLEGYNDIGISFIHRGDSDNFNTEGQINIVDGEKYSGKIDFFRQKLSVVDTTVEIRTPIQDAEFTKLEYKHEGTKEKMSGFASLEYGASKRINYDISVYTTPNLEFNVAIKTPFDKYEDMVASATVETVWPKLSIDSKINVGDGRPLTLRGSVDASTDINCEIALSTPIEGFSDVGLNFFHSGNADKFKTEGKITFMDDEDISGKVDFLNDISGRGRLSAKAELNTPFNYAGYRNRFSTTAALEYRDSQKMGGNMKPNLEAVVTIKTPFREYREISAQGSLDITAPSYSADYSVNIGDITVHSANGKLNTQSIDDVEGSLEIVLPIEGIEFTKAEYQHKMHSSRLDGSVSLKYGDSKTISGDLKASNNPNYDITINVNTPFVGYENMQGSATYDVGYNKYDLSSSISLGRDQTFSITSGLDVSDEPSRASVQISTPYNDYRNMELVLTQEGTLDNFRCTGFLTSPLTDTINAETSVRYNTPSDMEASASVKSSFEGMDDLMAEVKNSDVAGEKKTHAAVGWTSGQQVVFDGFVHQQESWYENKVNGEVSLSTPFVAVRNMVIQMEHSGKQEEATQTLNVELNGDRLLDVDTEYSSKSKHQASVTFKKPLAMKYSVAASSDAGVHEAEVLANWNRDETDSNVRLLASVRDQSDSYKTEHSVDIGVEHASRKMGIVHTLSSSDPLTSSFGKFYWDSDDSSKVFYDMQIKDNSRRRKEVKEGYINLGLPSRTLGLSGSYSDNRVSRSGDATFSWDTDRNNKQVGIKGTITRGDRITGDVTLSMPAIRKEIRVDGELMSRNGRIILDTKTDISYSPDSRKTLTLTSKLEDISDYYSNYNYSLALGVSHPYTNVDIQMTSHLGSSDEKMTVGVNTDYLTARRENKNLGLLAEINKLKKQINLHITNPYNKVEIIGDVISTSPYKVRMLNKIDDVEKFRSDFTLDEDNKAIELNMFQGSKGLRLQASYPNNTAFRSEVSSISYGSETKEALLAVRLNTSRLMHTRLHWKPDMLQRFEQTVYDWGHTDGRDALEVILQFHDDFSAEIVGKYTDITSSIHEEMSPVIDALDKALTQTAKALAKLSKEMRKGYRENTFHLQEMSQCVQDVYLETQERLNTLARGLKRSSKQVIQTLHEGLDEMVKYPIGQNYETMVGDCVFGLRDMIRYIDSCIDSCLRKVDEVVAEHHPRIVDISQRAADAFYNATYVKDISNRLRNIDVSRYVASLELPEEYTNAMHSAKDAIADKIGFVRDAPAVQKVERGINEVYQQGVWAYNYWELEKNIPENAEKVLSFIEEIVEDELKEYAHELHYDIYPITVWDPEHGEVQADFRLPVDVDRLDQVPDIVGPLTDQVVAYVPDFSIVENITDHVAEMWTNTPEEQDEVKEQLSKYKPTRRVRKHRGRKRSRQ